MATLIFTDQTDVTTFATDSRVSLREWLAGKWAVLFSHPEDFAPHPSTPSGFITMLADDFAACRVRPVTLGNNARTTPSWLDYAGADNTKIVVAVGDSDGRVVDLGEHTLARKIARLATPFVMVIDANARCRSTITYRTLHTGRARTIRDVLTVVEVLRRGERGIRRHRCDLAVAG